MTEGAFLSVSTLTLDQVTVAFNRAFEGYYLPMAQTARSLSRIMRETDVAPAVSVALEVAGDLAGICLVALRAERAWIAGMGVDLRFRGRGFGRRLLLHVMGGLAGAGIRVVSLEALAVNTPAIALYRSVGFEDTRELRVFQGAMRFDPEPVSDDPAVRIGPLTRRAALADFDAFHPVAPAWQREARSITRIGQRVECVGLWRGPQPSAYLLVSRNEDSVVIFDAGARDAEPAARVTDLTQLARHITGDRSWITVRAINVPAGDALGEALMALGVPIVARQREMALQLGDTGGNSGDAVAGVGEPP